MVIIENLSDAALKNSNNSKQELIVSTSAFSEEDLKTYLESCQQIEISERKRQGIQSQHTTSINSTGIIKANMTRAELYECSTIDDEEDEGDDDNGDRRQAKLSKSINDIMKYFDEEVCLSSTANSITNSPVKQSTVASVIARFRNKDVGSSSSQFRRDEQVHIIEVRSSIQELRNKYERAISQETESYSQKKSSPRSRKVLHKSIVEQINKLLKPSSSPRKTRTKPPTYRPQILPSPVSSPRMQRKNQINSCAIAEEVFRQLSVKDKALLYARLCDNQNLPRRSDQCEKLTEVSNSWKFSKPKSISSNSAAYPVQIRSPESNAQVQECLKTANEYSSNAEEPPENELQKSHDQNPNALSEHQLRVQASLQRLNIPDWFRQYNQTTARSPESGGGGGGGGGIASSYKPGNFTRKRTSESSGRWAGLNSKTTSLSSLGSQRSDRSPLLLSPSAHSHHGGQTQVSGVHQHHQHHVGSTSVHGGGGGGGGGGGTFSRWSTSHLNSSQTSPSCSQRGSFSRGGPVNSSFMSVASGQSISSAVRSSFRQPYLGWRSQEKLSQPRTPHERLASSLLAAQQQRPNSTPKTSNGSVKQPPVTPEIQSSIKEVTSAIVHYVNDQTQQQRSRSTSPNSRKCWLESSFVGSRPLDSPQTPVIDSATTTFNTAATAAAATGLNQLNGSSNYNSYNYSSNINGSYSSGFFNNSSAASSIYSAATSSTNADVLRMNGLNCGVGGVAAERSLSSASLEDVLTSLLGLPTNTVGTGASASDAYSYTRSTTGDSASESLTTLRRMTQTAATPASLQVDTRIEQRLRRRSEGDAPKQHSQHQQPKQPSLQQQLLQQQPLHSHAQQQASQNAKLGSHGCADSLAAPMRRVSLGDSSDSNKTTSELQIRCRNTKCDQSAPPADAKKYYKSCHNCSHLYCSRECRRAHWEKHRKACLHSRASNLCRQVLATCKDDLDSQRHLSLLARKGFLTQGRGVVRVLLRSAEAAEGFIKHGFQCMGEASYVRWPDLMPAEMGLELYSELLKLSTEYKPDSKMLIYVAICVVSEAPGTAQAPVKWERQLVSRCAKLKLCKAVLAELEQQQQQQQLLPQPIALFAVPEPATEILILTFNPNAHSAATRREVILTNILSILSRRGVSLRKHYPEIYQRLQTYAEGQTDKFQPVTLHPRDSQTGLSFVCIIMPVHSESGIIKMPSVADGGNRVNTIDVGAANALTQVGENGEAQS